MRVQRRIRPVNLIEQLEERRLFAVALPSDAALNIDGTMAFGDINGDGKLDMVQATMGVDTRTGIFGWGVDLYINRGSGQPAAQTNSGQLRTAQHLTAIPSFSGFRGSAVIGDVNGDGKNDIVVYTMGGFSGPFGGVLLGDGKGGFRSGGTFDLVGGVPTTDANWGLSLADFNGDKKKDLFVYTYNIAPQPYNLKTATRQAVTIRSTIGIALNNGAGSFRDMATMTNPLVPALRPAPLPAGSPPQAKYTYFHVLGAGDLDGNGKAEIVCQLDTDTVIYATPTSFTALAFGASNTIILPGAQTATGAQAGSTNITQDPLGNVLSPPAATPTTTPVFGSLPQPGTTTTPLPTAQPAFAFLTDVNRDGVTDIAAIRSSIVYVGVNRSLQVSLAQRPAIVWKQLPVPVPMNPLGLTGSTTLKMFIGDLDGKGTPSMCFLVAPAAPLFNPLLGDVYAILGVQSLPTA